MPQKYRTKKRFGQHFLHDLSIIQKMVYAINPKSAEKLIEIGPGLGALTFPLLDETHHLDVVEIDRDVIQPLQQKGQDRLTIHNVDALRFDFSSLLDDATAKLRVVGNLPYNISTPLIFHLLEFREQISDMHFMLQKEVVDHLTAIPGSKDYGRLSIMVQYFCQADYLFYVPPSAFNPPPKVDSAVLRIKPWDELPYVSNNHDNLSKLVKEAFSKRRKTLRNSLKKMLTAEQIESVGIDAGLRPEQLSVEDYVKLSNI